MYHWGCSVLLVVQCTTGGANIAGHVQTMVALTICPQMHSTWSIHDLHDDLGDDRIVIV